MKSNKQRKSEIKHRRWKRMEQQREAVKPPPIPPGAVVVDAELLATLNNGVVWGHSGYYEDAAYRCCDCGVACVWTAHDQKWWYEEAQGSVHASATRCAVCRTKHREWRLSHCNAVEMDALRTLWRSRPDQAARARVTSGLTSNDPALRCLAAQALAWWWVQYDDRASQRQLENVNLETSWAPRIRRILKGEIELHPSVCRVHRTIRSTGWGLCV